MTLVEIVRNLILNNAYTVSIDLKDAFWHIPIKEYFNPYLGFIMRGQKFQFRALPFGLSVAPRAFTKILAPLIQDLRNMGINVVAYLDDLLIWATSKHQCYTDSMTTAKFLMNRGFLLNTRKSHKKRERQSNSWV